MTARQRGPGAPRRLAYTVEEAARIVGVSRSLLYEEIRDGRLPVRKLRSRTLVRRLDLAAWLRRLPRR